MLINGYADKTKIKEMVRMTTSDIQQADKHFCLFVKLVEGAGFPTCEPDAVQQTIKVSQPGKPRNRSVILAPTREFLEDDNDQFNNIILAGIQKAKEVLRNPPSPDLSLQGQIHLGHNGHLFEKRIK